MDDGWEGICLSLSTPDDACIYMYMYIYTCVCVFNSCIFHSFTCIIHLIGMIKYTIFTLHVSFARCITVVFEESYF